MLLPLLLVLAPPGCFQVPVPSPGAGSAHARLIRLHRTADDHLVGGRFREAQLAFTRALAAAPNDPTLTYGLACALTRLGDFEKALDTFEAAMEQGYSDPQAAFVDRDLERIRTNSRFSRILPRTTTKPPSGAVAWTFRCASRGYALLPGDSLRIVHALGDGSLEVRDGRSGEVIRATDPVQAPIASIAVNRAGTLVAALHADGSMELVDPGTGAVAKLEPARDVGPAKYSSPLSFTAGDKFVVAFTGGGALRWSCDGPFLGRGSSEVPDARAQACDQSMAEWIPRFSGSTLWLEPVAGGGLHARDLEFSQPLTDVEFSPNGRFLAVGTKHGGVHLVDVQSGVIVWSEVMTEDATGRTADLFGDPLKVSTLSFAPASDRLAVCTTTDYFVGVFDVATGEQLWRTSHLGGRMGAPMSLLQSTAFVLGDGGRWVWEGQSGRALHAYGAPWPRAVGSVFAAHGSDIFLGGSEVLSRADAVSRKVRWSVARPAPAPILVRHPSGWIGGSFDPTAIEVDARAYDPKRLRLAKEGLHLLPPAAEGE